MLIAEILGVNMKIIRYLPFIFMLFSPLGMCDTKSDIIHHWEQLPSDSARQQYIYKVFLHYLHTNHLSSCLRGDDQC